MKTKTIGIGVAVLAALTLAGGSTSVAQTNDGFGGGDGRKAGHHKAGHDIIVKGSHNQIVLGDDNIVARGDIEKTETGPGEGEEAEAPGKPYATVNNRVVTFLSERERPTTASREVARLSRGTQVPIACFVPDGDPVDGNRTWYQVRAEPPFVYGYISAHFADLTGAVQVCPPTD
ncbi:hypothetical protein G4Z16_03020 [Streptomyces bathyalis]|uniref:SH3b domain-containing protein n=1 Tax=Streptomyces bathyalis TaxID=2710756 RepID=A0A7T1WQZ2_9ACTN|nr:hypothetical protein [Streptomyces bathyalis]QPP05532.1 hypothetical protein G4Z16_03020 [Streptomyces bathyalis]